VEAGFNYWLTGSGWSEGHLGLGGRWITMTASYLGDALGELLGAVLALCDGAEHARVSWDEEPGEYRWLFDRDGDDVHVRVLWFDDLWNELPDDRGEERLAGTVALASLAEAVASGARKALDRYGEQGYREKWPEHDFPTAALTAIEAHLRSFG
jgi:hypothetical protein